MIYRCISANIILSVIKYDIWYIYIKQEQKQHETRNKICMSGVDNLGTQIFVKIYDHEIKVRKGMNFLSEGYFLVVTYTYRV